jgi:hypothetical protein
VREVEILYGKSEMDFCVHSLLHLTQYVELFGPLWITSNFKFEGLLKIIKSNLHGTNRFEEQFITSMKILKYVSNLEFSICNNHPKVQILLQKLHSTALDWTFKEVKFFQQCKITSETYQFLKSKYLNNVIQSFHQVKFDGITYCTKERSEKLSTLDSSWITYFDGKELKYGRIKSIFSIQYQEDQDQLHQSILFEIIQLNEINYHLNNIANFIKAEETEKINFIKSQNLQSKLIPIIINNHIFLSENVKFY